VPWVSRPASESEAIPDMPQIAEVGVRYGGTHGTAWMAPAGRRRNHARCMPRARGRQYPGDEGKLAGDGAGRVAQRRSLAQHLKAELEKWARRSRAQPRSSRNSGFHHRRLGPAEAEDVVQELRRARAIRSTPCRDTTSGGDDRAHVDMRRAAFFQIVRIHWWKNGGQKNARAARGSLSGMSAARRRPRKAHMGSSAQGSIRRARPVVSREPARRSARRGSHGCRDTCRSNCTSNAKDAVRT